MNVTNITGAGTYTLSANKNTAQAKAAASFAEAMADSSSNEKTSKTSDMAATIVKKRDATKEFLEFMTMTPAERMQYTWLKQHGISKEEFDALSPEEKQKLMDKMKQEMELRTKLELEKKSLEQLGG